jgi:hypothetical protein
VSPIDLNHMRLVWQRWLDQSNLRDNPLTSADEMRRATSDFANLPTIHAAMEHAHGQLLGFQLVAPVPSDVADEAVNDALRDAPRTDSAHASPSSGVGRIPRLPRPKFLSAIADFALGE